MALLIRGCVAAAADRDVIQEHVDLFWAAKVLPETSRRVLLGVVAQKTKALDECAEKLERLRQSVRAHFGGERADSVGTWQGCTRAEAGQSFEALERLIGRERSILKAVEGAMS